MSIPVRSLRLLPKPKSELDRLSGNKGEIFYDSTSKSLRIFDGAILGGTLLNASVTVAETPPTTPNQGSLWFNSANGSLYIYYQDINSNQWVTPIVPAGLIGSGATSGANTSLTNLGATAINASLIPSVDSTINLGSLSKKWEDLYLNGSVYLGSATISSTGNVVDLPAGSTVGGTVIGSGSISINDLSDVDTTTVAPTNGQSLVWNSVDSNWKPGTITSGSNSFSTISIAGQSDVVADSITDILTLASGTGITITTTPGSDTITFTNSGIPNSFATISVAGQTNVVADSSTDILTLVAGTGITLTTNAATDTITVASGFNQSLNTTDAVVFNSVIASTLTSNGVGTPTYTSASDFIFNTGNSIGALVLNGDLAVTGVATLGNLGIANGIASLGADGKLAASQIPTSLTGAVVFKGTWNANTNSPTLADGSGTSGWQYAVSTGGTVNLGSGSITFVSGDYVIYNGTIWQRIPSNSIAAAGTLTGTTLNATVVSSSLTSVGTLTNLTVTNTITGSISGNAATATNGVVTTGTYSDPTWLTLTAGKVGLGSVNNTADANKPISSATQTALDLKSPKADPIFTGLMTSQQSTEVYAAKTSATGTVTHDFSTGAIWSHASIAANFTANFTNIPTTVNRTIVLTLILLQGATPFIPTAVQIDGIGQTLNWQGGSAPTAGANKKEIVSFTLIRSEAGPSWTVLGSLTSYG
jgi:hypothetical protein